MVLNNCLPDLQLRGYNKIEYRILKNTLYYSSNYRVKGWQFTASQCYPPGAISVFYDPLEGNLHDVPRDQSSRH